MRSLRAASVQLLLYLCIALSVHAQPLRVDFRQAANDDRPLGTGEVHWIQSILQKNNATYYEGMSVPQRILLSTISTTRGNRHALTFSHKATKGGKHAFDYLTSYSQAVAAANAIVGPTILHDLNECGAGIGPPQSLQQTCDEMRTGPYRLAVAAPDNMGTALTHDIAASVARYETRFGNRTVQLYGDRDISDASLVFDGYTSGQDVTAQYTLSWTSASRSILIEFAVHLAMGFDVSGAGSGIGYGSGYGAGSINGGSYHVRLDELDGRSLGSRDNQIMGTAILTSITCATTGPDPVCAGTQNQYTFNTTTTGLTYSWSLTNNTSGASIVGSYTGSSVLVDAGSGPGEYTLLVIVRDAVQTVICQTPVTVNGFVITASPSPMLCSGGSTPVTVTANGGAGPYTGTGIFHRSAGTHTFTVTDANGCSGTASVTITEPPQLTATANAAPLQCNSGSTTVTVDATGGTSPYQGTGSFQRGAGQHSFTVTDANGCASTVSVTINAPPVLAASANAVDILCHGGSTTVTVSASGGTAPYTGTGTFQRGAGTHTFTVTDANGCSESASVTILEPAFDLIASANAAPILCFGGTSSVTVSATGGTPPYTGTGTFDRGAGTYTFTVTDDNGCTATSAAITITEPQASLSVSATATSILCNGGTATVTVSASGGTAPYTGTGTFDRGAGTYTFTVTDVNGCSASSTPLVLSEPSALVVTASAPPIPCTGGTTTVTVSATGGTPPYSGTGTFVYGAGSYTFTVTDANGCSASSSVTTLTDPAQLVVTVSATPILCHGGTSTVTVSATGGTPPYSGTGSFSRGPGTYTFTVTDYNGCAATSAAITITQPPTALSIDVIATQILCNGGDATVTVTASGGTPPYSGTGSFNHGAGTYTFTVNDANGCSATSAPVTLSEPPLLAVSATAAPIACYGGTTTVTVSASGGTPPYIGTGSFVRGSGAYTFTVTDANGCSASSSVMTLTEPTQLAIIVDAPPILCNGGTSTITVSATGGTSPYTGTGSFSRGPGSYTLTVTDANGCTATSTTVTLTEPPLLTASATTTQILCHGDNATVTVSASGGTAPYSGTGTFSRGAGTHTLTVTDANGCTADVNVTITEPPLLAVTASATPIPCNGGTSTVTVSATGGVPPYIGTGTFIRSAGTYAFTVTDANGCIATSSVTTLTEPDLLVAVVDAPPIACNAGTSTVTVSATGGTAPYSGTGTFSLGAGTYTFTVTDANGCSTTSTLITLIDPPLLTADANATPILCHGDQSTVTVTASGGTPPYAGTGTFSRGAGSYSFTVTDANGCTATANVALTQPTQLVVSASAPSVACGNDSSTVTVTASGGTPPYIGTGTFLRGLGTYTFIVTDDNGCIDSAQITVTGPPQLIAAASATPILCNGDLSTITVTAWGGNAPYTGTGTFLLGAGTYSFTVTDASNCTNTVVVTITEPPALVATIVAPPIPCNGGVTTVTVSASGGTPPYSGTGTFSRSAGTYTFVVTDGNGCADSATITLIDPPTLTAAASATSVLCHGDTAFVTVTASGGTPPYTGTGVYPITAGTYTFSVADANGCTANTTITVIEPPALVASANTPVVQCGRDSAVITISALGGTPPYSGVGNFTRIAGTYTFFVTDANGCVDSVQATVSGPPPLFATAGSTPILCNGGTSVVTVSAWGGTPPYTGVGTFNVIAGTYTFVVIDANNCTDSITITIVEPPLLSVICSISDCVGGIRTISATVTGGTPPYSYVWSPFGTNTTTVDVPCSYSGTVTLRVRDSQWSSTDPNNSSCEAWCTLQIFSKSAEGTTDAAPQAANDYALFENYPNPFNPSTTIRYFLPEASLVRLTIVNTLGRTIATLVDTEVPGGVHHATWDANTVDGMQAASGSYIYRIHATSVSGDREFVQERMMLLLR